jgi:MinD superfamily P-loop ATPase
MSFKIAIASGKGGTGKTIVSVNLLHFFANQFNTKTLLVDCDVEEPNDHLFFPEFYKTGEIISNQSIAKIDNNKCTYTKKCVSFCEFNAITVLPSVNFAIINADLCHSCGACLIACENNAITEYQETIGTVSYYHSNKSLSLISGQLKIGSSKQTTLIKELKKSVLESFELIIYDSPPGTSCPVVETVSDVDFVILVAEPTLFGVHDLKIMVELLTEIQKPFGVIINKAGLGSNAIYEYLEAEKIEVLGEIPFSKKYAANYAKGKVFEQLPQEIASSYQEILDSIYVKKMRYARDYCA